MASRSARVRRCLPICGVPARRWPRHPTSILRNDVQMAERPPFDAAAQISSELEIARQPLDETIANHLRELIIRGEMAPGAKIHLPELAVALGVSTTPLREALKILAEE